MPPARTIVRRSNYTNSVNDIGVSQNRDVQKRYIHHHTPTNNHFTLKKGQWKTNNNNEEKNYMDLDEFIQNTVASTSSDSNAKYDDDEDDYTKPKPVDLLASLLTLGKMIQNQKQLIQNQNNEAKLPMTSISRSVDPELMSVSSNNDKMDMDDRSLNDELNTNSIKRYEEDENLSPKRQVIPEEIKDFDYWDRRKRNNLAAKKSREERRKKELEIVETTKQLETENSQLTLMLKRLTARNEWLESRVQNIRGSQRSLAESSSLSSSAENI